MGLMKRLRTAETNGHPIPEGGNAIIKACRAEQVLKAWQAQSGPPEPPQANTGFYACDGAYHWVGTGPWPEYRPPGLAWDRGWKQKKPADVPWLENTEAWREKLAAVPLPPTDPTEAKRQEDRAIAELGYLPHDFTPKADDAWAELDQAVAARIESGKPYTVDDAWNEADLARKARAKEFVASFFNGAPPPPKPKRSKKRTDGLTQGYLF